MGPYKVPGCEKMKHLIVLEEPENKIASAIDLFERIKKIEMPLSQEVFIVFTLNTKMQVINFYIVSMGILDASLIHPREVFRDAIKDNAHSIIVAHNHPSGHLAPSGADIEVMKLLKDAGELLGIHLIDSIIFNDKNEFISMKEQGTF